MLNFKWNLSRLFVYFSHGREIEYPRYNSASEKFPKMSEITKVNYKTIEKLKKRKFTF